MPGAPLGTASAAGADPERGSQALEFALVLPAVMLLLVLLLHAGMAGADLIAAQGLAREAARLAAVADDTAVRAGIAEAAGGREVRVALSPAAGARAPGGLVTARIELRSGAFAAFGPTLRLQAQATMRVEDS